MIGPRAPPRQEGPGVDSHDADFVAAACTVRVFLDAGCVLILGDAGDFWRDGAGADHCGVRWAHETLLLQALNR